MEIVLHVGLVLPFAQVNDLLLPGYLPQPVVYCCNLATARHLMLQSFTSTETFVTAIAGRWLNPVTGTIFHFLPLTAEPGAGEIVIRTEGNYSITMTFTARLHKGSLLLCTGNNQYEVFIMGSHVQSLTIALSSGNLLQLVKGR